LTPRLEARIRADFAADEAELVLEGNLDRPARRELELGADGDGR